MNAEAINQVLGVRDFKPAHPIDRHSYQIWWLKASPASRRIRHISEQYQRQRYAEWLRDATKREQEKIDKMVRSMEARMKVTPCCQRHNRRKPAGMVGKAMLHEISDKYSIPAAEIDSDARFKRLQPARRELYYRLANEHGWTLTQIGRFLGKDHTTILHGIRKHCAAKGCAYPESLTKRNYRSPSFRSINAPSC